MKSILKNFIVQTLKQVLKEMPEKDLARLIDPVVEKRILNRCHSVPIAVSNAVYNNINGDYLEFGVREGNSFVLAWENYQKFSKELEGFEGYKPNWRFFAFDAFDDGLPESEGIDKEIRPVHWTEGSMKAVHAAFVKRCLDAGMDKNNFRSIKGFFENTLTTELKKELNLQKAAVIHLDCDLYQSTVEALNYCTPLVQLGTTIVFDDYFRYKGSENHGQFQAFKEWKQKNPQFSFRQMNIFYGNSTAFICSDVKA